MIKDNEIACQGVVAWRWTCICAFILFDASLFIYMNFHKFGFSFHFFRYDPVQRGLRVCSCDSQRAVFPNVVCTNTRSYLLAYLA